MRGFAPLLVASLLASLPIAARAQGIDAPPDSAPPDTGAMAPVAPSAPPSATPAPSPTPAPAAAGAPVPKKQKNGLYFGFSLGTGTGTIYSGGSSWNINDYSYFGKTPTTLAMQVRTGWGTGDLLFGMQLNLTRSWVDVGGTSVGMDFMAFDVVATWWSQEMGLYTRIGVGPSQFSAFSGSTSSKAVNGAEMMVGLGFTMGGFGVGMDYFRQYYTRSEAGFDSVGYFLAMVSLDLY